MRFRVDIDFSPPTPESDGDIQIKKCEWIRDCIEAFLSKNTRLSQQSIEDRTGVSVSTIRRFLSLKGNPNPEVVIKIFTALGQDEQLYKYMLEFHPDIATIMAEKSKHNSEYNYIEESEREYFINEDYYLITNLAYTEAGTSEAEISYELGRKGIERLFELTEKGIVQKTEDGKYVGKLKNYKLSLSDTKRRAELSLRFYRMNEAGGINNWISFQTESLNEEGLKALKLMQQQHFNERKNHIFNNPNYKGNIKIFNTSVSSTFLSFTSNGGLQ